MWESPIKQITSELQFTYENECMKIVQGLGFDVDKEELIKALQYDRNQYEKGYNDAIQDFYDKVLNFEDYIKPEDIDGSCLLYAGRDMTYAIVKIKEELTKQTECER